MVPEPGMTCLGMEYFCFKGDGSGRAATRTLIAQAAAELEALGLAQPRTSSTARSSGCPRRIRSTTRRTAAHLDDVREFIDPIPNLHTVGRNGMHKYNNQDHSMLAAMMAVGNMQGALARSGTSTRTSSTTRSSGSKRQPAGTEQCLRWSMRRKERRITGW